MQVKIEDFKEFMNGVVIRNNLVTMKRDELLSNYSTILEVLNLLLGVLSIYKYDEGFFYLGDGMLDNLIDYLETIADCYSFYEDDVSDVDDMREYDGTNEFVMSEKEIMVRNDIIDYCNEVLFVLRHVRELPSEVKDKRAIYYLEEQAVIRHMSFDASVDLASIFASDAELYLGLINGNVDDLYIDNFIYSTNYFLEMCPYIYGDKELNNLTNNKINKYLKRSHIIKERNFRRESKNIIHRLN